MVAVISEIDFRGLHVNSPTAAFSFLLLILGLATKVGLKESITASLAGVLAYNFFFLPPVGTLTITDPQNWVALFVFLVTAITASHLSSSARKRAEEAAMREHEVQRLYEFSRSLMLPDSARTLADHVVRKISEIFQLTDVALYDRRSELIHRTSVSESPLTDALLRETAKTGTLWQSSEAACLVVPIRLGGPPMGSVGVTGTISEIALKSIAQLIAIVFERARAEEVAARAEATQQNEQLKATLLDALAHEFKTPLTSIKAATSTILSRDSLHSAEKDLVSVVDEEADRLNSLVTEAIELARLGSGGVKLHLESCAIEKLIYSAVEQLRRLVEGRTIDVRIDPGLPLLSVDCKLAELAFRQTINNALKYSPPSSAIEIRADKQGDAIVIQTSNEGPGIPDSEQDRVFEKFYRGRDVRTRIPGTGMGLAIAREIIESHGGRIWLKSEPGRGVQLFFTLPTMLPKERIIDQTVQTVA